MAFTARAQYYLRGEIKDEKNQSLQNAKVLLHSTRHVYYTGSYGGFGITTKTLWDSLTISVEIGRAHV